jgi:hypothetical protein
MNLFEWLKANKKKISIRNIERRVKANVRRGKEIINELLDILPDMPLDDIDGLIKALNNFIKGKK